jgi:hypothetical protein
MKCCRYAGLRKVAQCKLYGSAQPGSEVVRTQNVVDTDGMGKQANHLNADTQSGWGRL